MLITEDDVKKAKAKYPGAIVMAHPECTEPVKELADEIFSTGQMLKFADKSDASKFYCRDRNGNNSSLKKAKPGQANSIRQASGRFVPNMKKITLDKVLWSLEDMQYKITVPMRIAAKSKKSP